MHVDMDASSPSRRLEHRPSPRKTVSAPGNDQEDRILRGVQNFRRAAGIDEVDEVHKESEEEGFGATAEPLADEGSNRNPSDGVATTTVAPKKLLKPKNLRPVSEMWMTTASTKLQAHRLAKEEKYQADLAAWRTQKDKEDADKEARKADALRLAVEERRKKVADRKAATDIRIAGKTIEAAEKKKAAEAKKAEAQRQKATKLAETSNLNIPAHGFKLKDVRNRTLLYQFMLKGKHDWGRISKLNFYERVSSEIEDKTHLQINKDTIKSHFAQKHDVETGISASVIDQWRVYEELSETGREECDVDAEEHSALGEWVKFLDEHDKVIAEATLTAEKRTKENRASGTEFSDFTQLHTSRKRDESSSTDDEDCSELSMKSNKWRKAELGEAMRQRFMKSSTAAMVTIAEKIGGGSMVKVLEGKVNSLEKTFGDRLDSQDAHMSERFNKHNAHMTERFDKQDAQFQAILNILKSQQPSSNA
jgi:hypothetical protein